MPAQQLKPYAKVLPGLEEYINDDMQLRDIALCNT